MKIATLSLSLLLLVSQATAFTSSPRSMRGAASLVVRPSTASDDSQQQTAVADALLTDAGLLKRDRYIATNRFTVRQNQAAKFEKRWATRKSKLAVLDGFQYFQLMRRVTLSSKDGETMYDEGDSSETSFENYVSFTIWQKKSHFNAWRNGEVGIAVIEGSLGNKSILYTTLT